MSENKLETRDHYKQFYPVTTRWMDNDYYGHVNNVTYYSYFDTAANQYLIEVGGLNLATAPVIAVVVNSCCTYKRSVTYPQKLEVGLGVNKLGNSSVQYGLAIFVEGEGTASAYGEFVHVFVDRQSNKPVPIPDNIRIALEKLLQ